MEIPPTLTATNVDEPRHAGRDVAHRLAPPVRLGPVRMGQAPQPPSRLRAGALVLALAAHATLLYALALEPADLMAGGGGQLDAISVTIVSSAVLESRDVDRIQPPAPAAAAAVEAHDGGPDSTSAPPQPEQKQERQEEQQQQEPPVQAEAIMPMPPKTQEQNRTEAAAPAGGVPARGDAPKAMKQSGPAAASAGAVREYARYVSQALARTKPKGVGGLGTVKIKLVILPSGGLASVEIAKSSGNTRLDEMALAAVRRTALPAPPLGMTVAQLTYEIPYHFR